MPNPITSVTFEPDTDGTMICTATYSVQQTGTTSDWGGSSPGARMYVNSVSDGSDLRAGHFQPCSRTRMSQTYRTSFPVYASEGAIKVGLEGQGGTTGTAIQFWDIDLTVEFVKR